MEPGPDKSISTQIRHWDFHTPTKMAPNYVTLVYEYYQQHPTYDACLVDAGNPNGDWVCTITVPFVPAGQKADTPFRTIITGARTASKKLAKQVVV